MEPVPFAITVIFLVLLGVNAYGAWLWRRLNDLVLETAASEGKFVGDNVAKHYTNYLFVQITSTNKFRVGPQTMTLGNPENERVVRAVKASDEYARIQEQATYVRGVPILVVAYIM